jgi:glycerol-3-phosphate dehydrogenase
VLGPEGVARAIPGVAGDGLLGGGDYLDGATDDARLCLAVVTSAARAGALAVSRVEATALENGRAGVAAELRDVVGGERLELRPRAVVLAGGPLTDELRGRAGLSGTWVRPTRGSHVLVPRERLPTDGAVILNSCVDGRVLFLIPRPRFTLIGTTDLDAEPSPRVRATRAEVAYLRESANALVPGAILREEDVVSTYAGLRPLIAASESNPSARSREERSEREGAIYTLAGGKLTAFRAMAERLGARIARDLERGSAARRSPTRGQRLSGALAAPVDRPVWSSLGSGGAPERAADPVAEAWEQRYGALAGAVREACAAAAGGDARLSEDTLAGEVDWAVRHEDCQSPADFLFRRTDVGLEAWSVADAAAATVVERMAALLGWDAERAERERESTAAALQAPHAWRSEPD